MVDILNTLSSTFTGEGHTALSVSAFYGWQDIIKYLVDTIKLDPKGISTMCVVQLVSGVLTYTVPCTCSGGSRTSGRGVLDNSTL